MSSTSAGLAAATSARPAPINRWLVVGVLAVSHFMLFLDETIVNVALPSIAADLHMTKSSLAWVVNAYVLLYGGMLLLGGRLADIVGKRAVFLTGISVFGIGSALSGAAATSAMLVIARGVQGLGAALTAPAALAIVVGLFDDRGERAKVMGIWAAVAGLAATLGLVLGGVVTDVVSWRLVFLINIPAVLGTLIFGPAKIPTGTRVRGVEFDLGGAALGTASVTVLVYSLLQAHDVGWASARTLVGFAAAAVLAAAFLVVERRARQPLLPLAFLHNRRRNAALGLQCVLAATLFGLFFIGTLYLQQVLGYSPLRGGLAWLAFSLGYLAGFGLINQLIFRLGARAMITAGLVFAAGGLLWFAQAPTHASYILQIAGPMIVAGVGLSWAFIGVTITVMDEVNEREEGVASGLLITGHQIGGAIGLSVLVSIAVTRTQDLVRVGVPPLEAQVRGGDLSWVVSVAACLAAAVFVFFAIGRWVPRRPETISASTIADATLDVDDLDRGGVVS